MHRSSFSNLSRRAALRMMGGISVLPLAARAQSGAGTYRIIVSFVPGGTSDIVARTLAPQLSQNLGHPVIVENRPGAAGNLALDLAARAEPDGRTLLLSGPGQLAINPHLYRNLRHAPITDMVPVAMVGEMEHAITVTPGFPAKTLAEYIQYAKQHPEELTFGSSGVGTTTHMCGALFAHRAQIALKHVGYKGAAQAVNDVIAGHVNSLFDLLPSTVPHIRSGKLRAIATTGSTRAALLPDIPTVAESGLPGFASTSWHALMTPKGVPEQVRLALNSAVRATMADPKVRARLQELGVKAMPMTADGTASFLQAESAKWGEVVRAAGITIDNA